METSTWVHTGKWAHSWDDEADKTVTGCFQGIRCMLSTQTQCWTSKSNAEFTPDLGGSKHPPAHPLAPGRGSVGCSLEVVGAGGSAGDAITQTWLPAAWALIICPQNLH